MNGTNIVIKLTIFVCVIITSAITSCSAAISDRRLCFDPKCSVPISLATTLMTYRSNDPGILSFEGNSEVRVFSKSAGTRKDLWGVEINGKRGYIPASMIREKKVFKKQLIHDVPTEQIIKNNGAKTKSDDVPNVTENVDENVGEVEKKPDAPERSILDKLLEEVVTSLFPEPSQISPSFEVHDGTTIPVAVNEEPIQPSYSTNTPRINAEIEQHPVLSVHPNIASSVTSKNQKRENFIDDDSEKTLNVAASTNEEKKNPDEQSEDEITKDSTKLDENNANNENLENSSSYEQDELNREKISNFDESPSEAGTPEEQSEAENIDEADIEKTLNSENISSIAEDRNEESKNNGNEDNEQVAEKENTIETKTEFEDTGKTLESFDQQQVESKTTEKHVDEEQEEEKTTEKAIIPKEEQTTEAPREESAFEERKIDVESSASTIKPEIPESPTEESTTEKNYDKINDESAKSTNENETIENLVNSIENTTLAADTLESSQIDTKTVEPEIQVPENIDSNETGLPVDENSNEKSSEDEREKLNPINPIFSRLSSMVKEIVSDALSSSSETKTAKADITEEPATKNTNEEIVNNENDVKIKHLSENTDARDVNDSIESETSSEHDTTEPEVVKYSSKENFVNIVDSNNNSTNNNNNNIENENNNVSTADNTETNDEFVMENTVQPGIYEKDDLSGFVQENNAAAPASSFNGFPANRNLLNVGSGLQPDDHKWSADSLEKPIETIDESQIMAENTNTSEIIASPNLEIQKDFATETSDSCLVDDTCQKPEGPEGFAKEVEDNPVEEEIDLIDAITVGRNYWEILTFLVVTALTTSLFSLGYYYIENTRRDGQYIAKINQLEKQLLVCSKECMVLDDTLKSTKTKLDSIEDESFGSNEMVASLKADLETANRAKSELEEQVAMLEKELESATEAGLGLERMLREILSTNNEDNPLAQSVEDLQTRLNAQQAANEALTNALNSKAQENETLNVELKAATLKTEKLEIEVARITEELKRQNISKSNLEHSLLEKIENLEIQAKDITADRSHLRKQLRVKEMEMDDLLEVVSQMKINNLDFDKLYNVSKVKAEASQLLEERDELKIRLSEVEGAHQLLEEHVKIINEEVTSLSEQCKLAEKAKRDAETKVEVLSNFFKEKEAQRQKEEAVWLQKQGEVTSTVERLHSMQNEIHNYKQQIEMLKREILDQEREYKNQISALESKSHENWVIARQNERRLEESKAEASQLRNRLTLIEKNLNEIDPEAKLHRLEANGETPTSPQLFIGAEASSSPIMFTGSSGVPLPPPPSYLYGPPVPPFMPPPPPPHTSSGITPFEVGQRPPPLGGRLSSPPPLHPVNSGRYDDPRSPPPPHSPTYRSNHRGFLPPFPNDRIHPPPPPHNAHIPPPPLSNVGSHTWGDEAIPPPPRNSGFQPHHQQQQQQQHHHHHHHQHPQHHHHQRDNQQRSRNRKGSLHSSGESLDKNL